MMIRVVDRKLSPGKVAWENYTLYHEGFYYATFNVTADAAGSHPRTYALDIFRSSDGVHWEAIGKELLPIAGAHAGYSLHRFGDTFMYHPTCTDPVSGIHFKTFRSKDLLVWESMGSSFDVPIDHRYYRERWDELVVLDDIDEQGNVVYYGFISSEVRDDVGPPSCGMLKSADGLHWEVLAPPLIAWGMTPPHHMEVNFCEKIDGRYYLNMSGRLYMDSMGYSLYTFVADRPEGPYVPDRDMFRLCGTSMHDVTWLSHTFQTPDGLLCATWLSKQTNPAIPSGNFTIAPFKRLLCVDGHLRLGYWNGNDAAKVEAAVPLRPADAVYPAETGPIVDVGSDGGFTVRAGRDGLILRFDKPFDAERGFIIEGEVVLRESRTRIETHHHAAHVGLYLESGSDTGTVMVADTHGVTRTGYVRWSDRRIGDSLFRRDEYSAQELLSSRSGRFSGTLSFDCRDTAGPYGHANSSVLRHGTRHHLRLIARGLFFELYIDDKYVQTFLLPETFTGHTGLVVCDGTAECRAFVAWAMD